MKNINKNISIIIFIVLSNIVLKLPFINNPISDWHSWNQVTTVATARYIVEDGWTSLFNAKVDLFESFKDDSNATFAAATTRIPAILMVWIGWYRDGFQMH